MELTVEQVDPIKLTVHPQNPRTGDIGAIIESIRAHDFFQVVGVQRSSGQIIYGNHRVIAALRIRDLIDSGESDWVKWARTHDDLSTVPVVYFDVDDETALRMMLVDNRTADLATYDEAALAALLTDLAQQTERALEGTAWTMDDLDDVIAGLNRAIDPPHQFPPATPQALHTEFECPSCGYSWAGKPRPG